MNSIKDIYDKLEKVYKVRWEDDNFQYFILSFSSDKHNYEIEVYDDTIAISKENKIFHQFFEITHCHSNNFLKENNFYQDMYEKIIRYINKYSEK